MKEDVEYGRYDDEEPSIRVDPSHHSDPDTFYYAPPEGPPSASYYAPGTRECSFRSCNFDLWQALGQCEPSKTPKGILN